MVKYRKYTLLAIVCLVLLSCEKHEIDMGNKTLQNYLLLIYDTNKDGKLSKKEALKVTWIDLDLVPDPIEGLENFPNLEWLYLNHGEFTSLNVSKNPKLKMLNCRNNKLKMLDLTNNPELETLECGIGEIESIILGNKPKLVELKCEENKLTSLDISGCHYLTSLGLSDNPHLEWLYCPNSQIEELDIKKCVKLRILNCGGNRFTSLDVSKNADLDEFDCRGTCRCEKLKVIVIVRTSIVPDFGKGRYRSETGFAGGNCRRDSTGSV